MRARMAMNGDGPSFSFINSSFVGVTQEDLSRYYILVIISIVCSITPIFYMNLLPIRAELETKQDEQVPT